MSRHHENVVWQSADGTWGIGFFQRIGNSEDEWDQEFDLGAFEWASLNHRSSAAAEQAWNGPNPGSHTVVPYSAENAAAAAEYDNLVWEYLNPKAAREKKNEELRARDRKQAHSDFDALLTPLGSSHVTKYVLTYRSALPTGADDCYSLLGAGSVVTTLQQEGDWFYFMDGPLRRKAFKTDGTPAEGIVSVKDFNRRARW